jgi:hypothetical protein
MREVLFFVFLSFHLSSFSQTVIYDTKFGVQGRFISKYPWLQGTLNKIYQYSANKLEIIGLPTEGMETNIGICQIDVSASHDNFNPTTQIITPEKVIDQSTEEFFPLGKYEAICRTNDNYFITGGSQKINSVLGVCIYKYSDSGKVDKKFGSNGRLFMPFDQGDNEITVTDILLARNNKVYLTLLNRTNQNQSFLLVCNRKGQLEKRIRIDELPIRSFKPMRLAESSNGIIVAGYTTTGDELVRTFLLKFNFGGEREPSFGTSGVVSIAKYVTGNFLPFSMVTDKNGSIFLCNSVLSQDDNAGIVKLTSNGNIDKTFFHKGYMHFDSLPVYLNRPVLGICDNSSIYVALSGYNYSSNVVEMHLLKIAASTK